MAKKTRTIETTIEDDPAFEGPTDDDPHDEVLDRLESFFSELTPGLRVAIFRTRPVEFRGYLEEIEITDTKEPIDLAYLIRTWGGQELQLKVRNNLGRWVRRLDLPLYSYPPMRYGRPLNGTPTMAEVFDDNARTAAAPAAPSAGAPPVSLGDNLAELLGVLQKYRTSDTQLITQLLQRSILGIPAAPPPPVNPYNQLNDTLELMAKLQGLFGNPAPVSGDSEMFGQIARLAELVLARDKQPQVKRLTPASAVTPIKTGPPASMAPPASTAPPAPMDIKDIVSAISSADPAALSVVIGEAFKGMTDDKKRAAIDAFEQQFEAIAPELFDDIDDDTQPEESEKTG